MKTGARRIAAEIADTLTSAGRSAARAAATDLDALRAVALVLHSNSSKARRAILDSLGNPVEGIPSTLGACADALDTLREQRLLIEKQAEAIKARETAIRNYLIDTLPKGGSTGVSGKVARAQLKMKQVPTVEDWPTLYKYVKRTGAFELLQRRLANDAVAERWEAGHKVPGIGVFNAVTVSVTKL